MREALVQSEILASETILSDLQPSVKLIFVNANEGEILRSSWKEISRNPAGADPGCFLGRGALFSCSTLTPINHIVFFCRIPFVLENRRSSQGCAPPAPSP